MTITAIDPSSSDAMALMAELDQELIVRYPEQPPHGIDCLDFKRHGGYFVVARENDVLLACGAFRPLDESCAENQTHVCEDLSTAARRCENDSSTFRRRDSEAEVSLYRLGNRSWPARSHSALRI
jgi:hypothetical protein